MVWINKISKIIFLTVFEYINTSFRLILRPRTTFRCLCECNYNNYISPCLFFLISVFIIQATSLVRDRVASKNELEYLLAWYTGFEIPVLGNVEFSYIFNFIGFFVGASCVLFILMSLIKGSLMYFKALKNIVLYSIIITVAFMFLDYILYWIIVLFLITFTSTDISFIESIRTVSVIENIDNTKSTIVFLFGSELFDGLLFWIVYVLYVYYLIGVFVPYSYVNRFLSVIVLVVSLFLIGLPTIYKNIAFYGEFRKIEGSTLKIRNCRHKLIQEKDSKDYAIKELFNYMFMEDEYFKLSKNVFLSAKDKLDAYRMYLQIKYRGYISDVDEEKVVLSFFDSRMLNYDEDHIRQILEKLNECNDVQRLYELEDLVEEENRDYKNMNSFEIFSHKFFKAFRKEHASIKVIGSLVRIMP